MNVNKKIVKKVMAGSMAVVMATGLAGVYSYHNETAIVRAAEETEQETKELTKIAENVLADQTSETDEISAKEESVYVKTDASGNISKTMVTEWLKNPEKGSLEDVSQLKDIKNLKGDETFSKGEGEDISWESEGEDIYYQGTTDKELPVGVKVSYKLNGKSVTPEELKGKNGKVEIRFDYTNTSKETVDVDGESVEMYTPFTMVTAMMLSTDMYKNISVENGKLISDGDKNIIVGIGFPGLKENLNLQNLDVEIPESVTVTADVTDASVGPTITLASADILSEFNLDEIDSFDELDDSIAQLKDATNQLVDGSAEAANGANALAGGAGTLASGAGTLAEGVNTLKDKSGELVSGVNTLAEGVGRYTYGVEGLYQGSVGLAEGAAQLQTGAVSLKEGINTAKSSADQLANAAGQVQAGIGSVGTTLGNISGALGYVTGESILESVDVDTNVIGGSAVLGEEQIANIVNSKFPDADDATKELVRSAIAEALRTSTVTAEVTTGKSLNVNGQTLIGTVDQAKAGVDSVKGALTDTENSSLAQGLEGVANGTGQLAATLGMGDGTNMTIGAGAASLTAGVEALFAGTQQLEAGAEELYNNSTPLMAGITSLKDGGSQLAGGVGQLASGAGQVSEGASELAAGSQTLAEGNQTLADGMVEYKKSAIDKMTDLFDGEISKVISRIDAMSTLANDYKSFAGIKEGVSGTTKFIIETAEVEE